jgi:hypothetical protein
MPEAAPPRIFISYSHDSPAHGDRVLELADRLRADGIDAIIDQYIQFPSEGWPAWCEAEIEKADFVLMVCTDIYLRRVSRKEEPGVGHGVPWEGRLIYQYLYDSGSVSRKFVPVLFADGSDAHVPAPVKGGTTYRVPDRYEALLRLLSNQPLTPMPPLGPGKSLPPRERGVGSAHVEPSKLAASLPHPRVEDLFVGRRAEREALAAALFPTKGTRRPVVVSGMAGVGKSYLIDRFFWENAGRFPGGYLRLAFDPDKPASAQDLLAILRDRLKLPAGSGDALVARLVMPLTLVHLENADAFDTGGVAGDLAALLPGCALVISARLRRLGAGAGWPEVVLSPFDTGTALEQLRGELGAESPGQESWQRHSAPCRWPCTWLPGICARTIGQRPFYSVCEPKILRSPAPIRRTRPFATAAAHCFPRPSSCRSIPFGARAEQTASNGSLDLRRLGTRRLRVSVKASALRYPVSLPRSLTTSRLPLPGCRCSTGCRGSRVALSGCTHCWPNLSARAPTRKR